MWISKLAIMAILLVPAALVGQEPGDSVRFWLTSDPSTRIDGVLVSAGDSLHLTSGTVHLAVSAKDVSGMRAYRGTRGHAMVGAMIGVASGAALGAAGMEVASQTMCGFMTTETNCHAETNQVLWGVAVGASIGAVLGAVIGSLVQDPEWEVLDQTEGTRVTIEPAADPLRGAVGLNVSVPVR